MSRLKPSFMIIGGVKCASSSLYRYLNDHPQILPCKLKEPSFFNNGIFNILRGYNKYKKLYPKINSGNVIADWVELTIEDKIEKQTFSKNLIDGMHYITGEASVTYCVRANPRVVKAIYPQIKLIYILREPAERFISHFDMFNRFAKEGRRKFLPSLDEYIRLEMKRFKTEGKSEILQQGIYIENVMKWKRIFKDNIFLLKDEDLNDSNGNVKLNELINWLGLSQYDFSEILKRRFNRTNQKTYNEDSLNLLRDFYRRYTYRLTEEFGIKFNK